MSHPSDFPDVLADADFIRDWRRDHSLVEKGTCHFCERREGDVLVDFEGAVVLVCDTCYGRGQDELPRGDADDEC